MDGLLGGFSALMSPDLWALMLVGVVVGIIFGAIPGLSATMAIVLFLPITFSLNVYLPYGTMTRCSVHLDLILLSLPASCLISETTLPSGIISSGAGPDRPPRPYDIGGT